ncbi:MAG: histidine phosphatase family protein, partial [Candidatus Omnitrophota bacterium]
EATPILFLLFLTKKPMKRLYLIRHAKSSQDISGIKDKERPLSKRGKREVEYIGKRLKKRGIVAQALYSSPAKRALDTARLIAKKISFPRKKIKVVPSIYDSDIPQLLKVVKNIDDKVESAVIFGHNPEFLSLVNYLTPRSIKEFPVCGVFGIDFNINSWRSLPRKKGKMAFFDSPKKDI